LLTIVMMFLPVIQCEQHCYTGPDSTVVSRNINSDALSIILDELFPVCGTCFFWMWLPCFWYHSCFYDSGNVSSIICNHLWYHKEMKPYVERVDMIKIAHKLSQVGPEPTTIQWGSIHWYSPSRRLPRNHPRGFFLCVCHQFGN